MNKFLMIIFVLSTILVACGKEKTEVAAETDVSDDVSADGVCSLCQDATSVQDPGAVTPSADAANAD